MLDPKGAGLVRILDLFCGVGGASAGYAAAGFEVIGVDIKPQPDYPFRFVQADALEYVNQPFILSFFDAIHASPPCQAYTALQKGTNAKLYREYPRLYEAVRAALEATGLPYVIENPAARPDVTLCGEMFGLGVLRHRRFEMGRWLMEKPEHIKHRGRVRGWRHGEFYNGPYVSAYGNGGGKGSVQEMRDAMGIHWTESRHSLVEAIPPAYTEFIGAALMRHLEGRS